MEKKGVKVGNKFIPVEAGRVIPMTDKEWNDFQKEMGVERDYFYMVGDKKYVHYEDEDYIRVSDMEQELDKAREEGFKEGEEYGYRRGCIDTCEIYEDCEGDKGEVLKFWKEKQLSKLKDNK